MEEDDSVESGGSVVVDLDEDGDPFEGAEGAAEEDEADVFELIFSFPLLDFK